MASDPKMDAEIANYKAEMEKMRQEREAMQRQMEDVQKNAEEYKNRMQTLELSYAKANQPRMLKTVETWKKNKIADLDQYEDFITRMYSEQENSSVASLLDNLTKAIEGKDSELERVTKQFTENEAALKAKEEEIGTLTATVEKYQQAIRGDSRFDASNMFDVPSHMDAVRAQIAAGTDGISGNSSFTSNTPGIRIGQPGAPGQTAQVPVEVRNSKRSADGGLDGEPSQKRARTEDPAAALRRPGQNLLLSALNQTPLVNNSQLNTRFR